MALSASMAIQVKHSRGQQKRLKITFLQLAFRLSLLSNHVKPTASMEYLNSGNPRLLYNRLKPKVSTGFLELAFRRSPSYKAMKPSTAYLNTGSLNTVDLSMGKLNTWSTRRQSSLALSGLSNLSGTPFRKILPLQINSILSTLETPRKRITHASANLPTRRIPPPNVDAAQVITSLPLPTILQLLYQMTKSRDELFISSTQIPGYSPSAMFTSH